MSSRGIDSGHAMSRPSEFHFGRSLQAFQLRPTRKARPVPELASEKASTSMIWAGVGMGRRGEGDERIHDHQSSSKGVSLGGVSGTWGLSCCIDMSVTNPGSPLLAKADLVISRALST